MLHFTARWLAILALSLSVLATMAPFGQPSTAAQVPPAVEACAGHRYTGVLRPDGTPFRNAGECMKYIRQGGEVVRRPSLVLTFTEPFEGKYYRNVSGFGLQPGAVMWVVTDATSPLDLGLVEADGTYNVTGGFYSCGDFLWMEMFTVDQFGERIAARTDTPC